MSILIRFTWLRRPRSSWQGEAGDEGIAVAVDACGEGMEAGEVVSPDGIEPLRQPFAPALGERLPEGADVAGESVKLGAVDQNNLQPKVLRLGEGLVAGAGSIRRRSGVTVAEP
ncbi:hypothetical protein ABZ946_36455 [Streptomyces sp. NPDC046324]|uniref:hypothetical protein n=1 Tax=Streptomyces sp. NPDC046324 TaxID=3154915 RepID=UPI0033E1D758